MTIEKDGPLLRDKLDYPGWLLFMKVALQKRGVMVYDKTKKTFAFVKEKNFEGAELILKHLSKDVLNCIPC